jgi:hypothetical protein
VCGVGMGVGMCVGMCVCMCGCVVCGAGVWCWCGVVCVVRVVWVWVGVVCGVWVWVWVWVWCGYGYGVGGVCGAGVPSYYIAPIYQPMQHPYIRPYNVLKTADMSGYKVSA